MGIDTCEVFHPEKEGYKMDDARVLTSDISYYCFDVLLDHLEGGKRSRLKQHAAFYKVPLHREFPLFVTWKLEEVSTVSHRLRGCIGTFKPMRLDEGLKTYVLASALEDRRFSPIRLDEVSQLVCVVSLLVDFEPATTWRDWEIGVHGISIEFSDPHDRYRLKSATFLPEVAKEQGWNHEETIRQLLRKATYRGKTFPENLCIKRYRSLQYKAAYGQYIAATTHFKEFAMGS
jgi:uncharacterized protein (TIGR00296 family)